MTQPIYQCSECEATSLLSNGGRLGGRYGAAETDDPANRNRWCGAAKETVVQVGCVAFFSLVLVLSSLWYVSETRPDDRCVCKGYNCTSHDCRVKGDHIYQAKTLFLIASVTFLAFLACLWVWKERSARKKHDLVLVFLNMQSLGEVELESTVIAD